MSENENKKTANAEPKREFFAAANTGRGFVSFYADIFGGENICRRYLIKGGPGTGKSTLMRQIADMAEGRGIAVERYKCSSDPTSLDGIILDGRVAVIDSTAPHVVEAELAGARDTLVDLGRFWDSDGLFEAREQIKSLTEKKKREYALAYRFLSSAMECNIASREMILPYVNKKRLVKLAKRLTRAIPSDGTYECKIRLSRAIGMNGRCSLDSFFKFAKRTVYIEEHYGMGYLVLFQICEEARNKGCRITVSYEPLSPEIPDAVFFEESKTLFTLSKRKKGAISLRRALDFSAISKQETKDLKAKSRNATRLAEALVLAATDELKVAGEAHFALENIYRANMNFKALNDYTTELAEKIVASVYR